MGRVSAEEMEEKYYDNYRAGCDGETWDFHAVSVRQAWYLAFQHFGDECLSYLAEIDEYGDVITTLMDKEEEVFGN